MCDFQEVLVCNTVGTHSHIHIPHTTHTPHHTHTTPHTPHTPTHLTPTHLTVLRPYKYAGYPMLIKTIERETSDDDLFSKSAPILTAASEVAFHTMNTSALNAEELRRENGIAVCYI